MIRFSSHNNINLLLEGMDPNQVKQLGSKVGELLNEYIKNVVNNPKGNKSILLNKIAGNHKNDVIKLMKQLGFEELIPQNIQEGEESMTNESIDHDFVLQHLASHDINASIKNGKVRVDKSDKSATEKHLKKIGYGHMKVEPKLNEEQLDEISRETKTSYVHKAFAHGNELHDQIKNETDPEKKKALRDKLSKRNQGIIKAVQEMNINEESRYAVQVAHKLPAGLKSEKEITDAAHEHIKKEMGHTFVRRFWQGEDNGADLVGAYRSKHGRNESVDETEARKIQGKNYGGGRSNDNSADVEDDADKDDQPKKRGRPAAKSFKAFKTDSSVYNKWMGIKEEELTLEDFSVDELEEFLVSEEFEQLDEVSKETLKSYLKKAKHIPSGLGSNDIKKSQKRQQSINLAAQKYMSK